MNSFPSAASIAKTGRKLTTVVRIAVMIAPPTSEVARKMTSSRLSSSRARPRWRSTFSPTMTPMSTIVPMAMAIPDSATMFASTPKTLIAMKAPRIASGRMAETRNDVARCPTITSTTSTVTSTSWEIAVLSVPSVSWMRPVRS